MRSVCRAAAGGRGPSCSATHVTGAAFLEFLPAGARAGVVAPGLQPNRRVDEIPAPGMLDERRTFTVLVIAILVVPARGEGDKPVLRLAAQYFGVFHLQAQPGALGAPCRHGGLVQFGLLGRQGGGHQVVDQAQHVSAVA